MEIETKREMTQRIVKELQKVLDMNLTELAAEIGCEYMKLYYCSNGRTKQMSDEIIEKICSRFPQISREYLRYGTGSILVGSDSNVDPNLADPTHLLMRVASLLDKVLAREDALDAKIAELISIEEKIQKEKLELEKFKNSKKETE